MLSKKFKQIEFLLLPKAGDTPGNFFHQLRQCCTSTLFQGSIEEHFEKSCDKIAQPDWLTLLAIRSDECRAHFANASKFNR